MRGIIGVVLAAGAGLTAWWAFSGARAGDLSYDWLRALALLVGILGLSLIFLQIRKWWMSE